MGAVQQDLHQRRMTIQRRGDADFHIWVGAGQLFHDGRQVPLQMNPQGQEVGHYQDPSGSRIGQARHGFGQVGPGFQESGLYALKPAGAAAASATTLDRFVGGWNAGPMRKDDNSRYSPLL